MADENSIPIEDEFSSSWDRVEEFYHFLRVDPRWDREHKWGESMLTLIAELRKRNYDKKLRARTSRAVLVLSRPRRDGLRSSQPFIEFHRDTSDSPPVSVTYHEAPDIRIRIDLDKVEITSQVEDLLNRLVEHPID